MKQKNTEKTIKYINSLIENTVFSLRNKTNNFFKKIIKYLNSLTEKTVFSLRNKTNNLLKKIIKYLNSLTEKTVFSLRNKTNNLLKKDPKVSNFNKILITFISLLFFYLFYLSIPTLYNKTWLQNNLEDKLFEEFNINFSVSSDISYNILPSPHFLIKNSKIFTTIREKPIPISEIKELKIFVGQKNFFNKDKIIVNKLIINKANFSLKKNDLIFLDKASHNKFSNKKIKIMNTNVFLKDNLDEVITIIRISKAFLFYDDLKFLNLLNLKGKIFNIPFNFDFNKKVYTSDNKEINIDVNKLKLNIFNNSNKDTEDSIIGSNIISIFNSSIYTKYNIKKDIITFESNNFRIKNSNMDYKGQLSLKPFDLKLLMNLKNFELSKLINNDSIIIELIKTKLLFNENISSNVSFIVNSTTKDQIFNSTMINFNILNGSINIDQTQFVNDKIGFVEIDRSNFFFEKDQLVLNTDIKINIDNHNNLFSFLGTSKKYRKQIKNIFINLNYNFSNNSLYFNKIKIDGLEVNNEILSVFENIDNIFDINLNKSRRVINRLFSIYAG